MRALDAYGGPSVEITPRGARYAFRCGKSEISRPNIVPLSTVN
jgi:hypothetical protein